MDSTSLNCVRQRCRTQFKLVESIEQQETQMNRLVEEI